MPHHPMLTLDTSIEPRICFWWCFSHSTQFGSGTKLYQEPMKPVCERGGFAAPLPALQMDGQTDGRTDGWMMQAPVEGLCEL